MTNATLNATVMTIRRSPANVAVLIGVSRRNSQAELPSEHDTELGRERQSMTAGR
jgi:hypothetical protein